MHSQFLLQLVKYLQQNKLTTKKNSLLDVIETIKKYRNKAIITNYVKGQKKKKNNLKKQCNSAKVSCKTAQYHKQLKRETVLIKSRMENNKMLIIWVSLLLSIGQQTSEVPTIRRPYPASILCAEIKGKQQGLKIRRTCCVLHLTRYGKTQGVFSLIIVTVL